MKGVLVGAAGVLVIVGLVAAIILQSVANIQTSAAQMAVSTTAQMANMNVTLALCAGSAAGFGGLLCAVVFFALWVRERLWLMLRGVAAGRKVRQLEPGEWSEQAAPQRLASARRLQALPAAPRHKRRRVTMAELDAMERGLK